MSVQERTNTDSGIVCVPFQTDRGLWGMAHGPEVILEAALITHLESAYRTVSEPIRIDFLK